MYKHTHTKDCSFHQRWIQTMSKRNNMQKHVILMNVFPSYPCQNGRRDQLIYGSQSSDGQCSNACQCLICFYSSKSEYQIGITDSFGISKRGILHPATFWRFLEAPKQHTGGKFLWHSSRPHCCGLALPRSEAA